MMNKTASMFSILHGSNAPRRLLSQLRSSMTTFNVNIVSDAICPFCYLGKKRFERAVDVYKKTVPGGSSDTFNITWKPFYLDPTIPQGKSIPVLERMAEKFGPAQVEAVSKRLISMGQPEGICFRMDGKLGNTRDAHRLMQLARTKDDGKRNEHQNKLMSAMMRRYFEEGGDITSQTLLLGAAAEAGLDQTEAKAWLDEGKGGDAVDKEVQEAYARGIQGVPHFIINGRHELSGAQDVEGFLGLLMRAKAAA